MNNQTFSVNSYIILFLEDLHNEEYFFSFSWNVS